VPWAEKRTAKSIVAMYFQKKAGRVIVIDGIVAKFAKYGITLQPAPLVPGLGVAAQLEAFRSVDIVFGNVSSLYANMICARPGTIL
jgi:hypothetical protein